MSRRKLKVFVETGAARSKRFWQSPKTHVVLSLSLSLSLILFKHVKIVYVVCVRINYMVLDLITCYQAFNFTL
jgi:hypothetical protein